MRSTYLFALAFVLLTWATVEVVRADCPAPGVLDEALPLVLQAHPVLIAEREAYQAQSRERDWDAYVRVGYAMQTTNDDAAGLNASLQVKIPLFSNTHKLSVHKARTTWRKAEDGARKSFLADIEKLCAQAAQVRELATMKQFYRDRLDYQQKRVDEEVEDPAVLWAETEKVQQTDYDHAREAAELSALRQTIARQYGGDQWEKLFGLLLR